MFQIAKLSVPDAVVEDNEDREVTIRYTPLGSRLPLGISQ